MLSSLDLTGSFHRFEVLSTHRAFLCCSWERVRYRFRRGPFGLEALAGEFQRVISDLWGNLPGVRVYMNDDIVFADSLAEPQPIGLGFFGA